jgi:predicted transport protein
MATPEEMAASMLGNVEAKTGRPLESWLSVLASSGLSKHGEMVKLLKAKHGVTHGYASVIVHQFRSAGDEEVDLVEAQYKGKEQLRPIYHALLEKVLALGSDVEVAPKKTYVSLRRKKQFAQIQPSTKTRVDVGLNLKSREPSDRLKAASGMCTHKVGLTGPDQIDDQLMTWIEDAYGAAG